MNNERNNTTAGGIGFCGLLAVAFIVLKLTGVINWSWLWVLAPIWIPTAITLAIIVIVLVVAAAALAFIVLYNLTNINITERQREIATLKVLGFTPREVSAYIYRETMLLSVIGCAVGLVLGVFMEGFVVVTAEVDQVMFGRTIHAASFVIAFLLTMLFTVLVMLAMRRKLARVDMVESLKSNE